MICVLLLLLLLLLLCKLACASIWGACERRLICACITFLISNYHGFCDIGRQPTYPFPNVNGFTAEVWEWRSNFIPPTLYDGCNYLSMLGLKLNNVIKGVPCIKLELEYQRPSCWSSICLWLSVPQIRRVATNEQTILPRLTGKSRSIRRLSAESREISKQRDMGSE